MVPQQGDPSLRTATSPVVSVIIPHYGDAAPTMALLDALLPQTSAVDAEIIVSDDCSPIPFPDDVPGVRTVRRERNGGFGSAVNTGASVAAGELLMILNSDLTVEENFLREYLAAARPWLPAVVAPRIVTEGRAVDTARRFPTIGHQVTEWLTPLARIRHTPAGRYAVGNDIDATTATTPIPIEWAVGAALLIPASTFSDIGGFDERFFMNAEEVDLQYRLAQRGIPVIYVPQVVVEHVGGGSSDPALRRKWVVESRLLYAGKWGGRRRLQTALTLASGLNLAWNGMRRLRESSVHPLRTARDELGYVWNHGR